MDTRLSCRLRSSKIHRESSSLRPCAVKLSVGNAWTAEQLLGRFEVDHGKKSFTKPTIALSKSVLTGKDAIGIQTARAARQRPAVSFAGYAQQSREKSINRVGIEEVGQVDRPDLYNFPTPSERLLRTYFNLTPAEIRLAQIISRGEPLRHAADVLGIKMPTARSQLASVFLKTKTLRQPQLVALLSRLAHLNPWLAN
jgi:DNA-binding CsgD family transcriptional regulator